MQGSNSKVLDVKQYFRYPFRITWHNSCNLAGERKEFLCSDPESINMEKPGPISRQKRVFTTQKGVGNPVFSWGSDWNVQWRRTFDRFFISQWANPVSHTIALDCICLQAEWRNRAKAAKRRHASPTGLGRPCLLIQVDRCERCRTYLNTKKALTFITC